jgi:hypothetical protein
MGEQRREWMSLKEAADVVGITMTTVRDWTRSGRIDVRDVPDGRVVDVQQVRERAMGPSSARPQSGLQDRLADEAPERSSRRLARERELAETLQGLQQLARKRNP